MLLGDVKQPDQSDRVLLEEIFRRDGEAFALDNEAAERAASEAPTEPRHAPLALLVCFENGAEYARQVTDILRDQEVVLHEAFDATAPGVVGIAHAGADPGLHVECQPLLRPPGEVVQVAAYGPQETLRA